MKRLVAILICAVLLQMSLAAFAADITGEQYTDVASVMTQDSVKDILLTPENEQDTPECALHAPDEDSMALLEQVYDFVWRKNQRPARFFDEDTQKRIQALLPGKDIDSLFLTEFMAQSVTGDVTGAVQFEYLLDVDYRPGQTVVALFGCMNEDGEYDWYAYLAVVPETGLLRFSVPAEEYQALAAGGQMIFTVLSERVGPRGNVIIYYEIRREEDSSPSKSAEDIIRIRRFYSEEGEPLDDSFGIFLVDRTEQMNAELVRIGEFISGGRAAIGWFPEEIISEAQLLLDADTDIGTMICYDAIAVMAKDYNDAFGDVATETTFPSEYDPEKSILVFLGIPMEEAEAALQAEGETQFVWYCLRAHAEEEFVEIVYKQLVIPEMERQPVMVVVFSQPLDE